jgi:hypothetical protein
MTYKARRHATPAAPAFEITRSGSRGACVHDRGARGGATEGFERLSEAADAASSFGSMRCLSVRRPRAHHDVA